MRSTLTTSFRALKEKYELWRVERDIRQLEQYEKILKATLKHVQHTALPDRRNRRNELMFRPKVLHAMPTHHAPARR